MDTPTRTSPFYPEIDLEQFQKYLKPGFHPRADEILRTAMKAGARENLRGIVSLVSQMREAQQLYFKTKSQGMLIRAKTLEKQVDALLKDLVETDSENQPKL